MRLITALLTAALVAPLAHAEEIWVPCLPDSPAWLKCPKLSSNDIGFALQKKDRPSKWADAIYIFGATADMVTTYEALDRHNFREDNPVVGVFGDTDPNGVAATGLVISGTLRWWLGRRVKKGKISRKTDLAKRNVVLESREVPQLGTTLLPAVARRRGHPTRSCCRCGHPSLVSESRRHPGRFRSLSRSWGHSRPLDT